MGSRTIRYGVLGSLSIQLNGSDVPMSAPRLRQLLALLLAKANERVATDDLIFGLWGESPPPGAAKALQVYIHRLRHALGANGRIVHKLTGYSLVTTEDELDSLLFADLAADARSQRRDGHLEKAADSLAEALQLWRGPAFEGLVEHPLIRDVARLLDEARLRVAAEHVEIELELGRHAEIIPRLVGLVESHPYHEELRGHLMLALYRAGRQTEALVVFRQTRELLAEELGVEPGPAMQRLHSSILRSAPELELRPDNPLPATVPRELPPAVTGFAGREAQVARLNGLIPFVGSTTSPQIALITGSGGVGKTATALHWAHQVTDCFPDGQLFVDMRGYAAGAQMRPIDALSAFLRSLGLPPQLIPVETAEAAALYRSRLSGRRMLVIIDNARSADDVRNLLPGTAGCLAVVTSRDMLTGLVARDGATRVPLDVLSPYEAYGLIAGLLHGSGHAIEPRPITELAIACAHLPLALRIAVALLLDRPYEPLTQQVVKLREGRRLELLAVDGDDTAAVRVTFARSYCAVSTEAQLLFRRLGLVPCNDFTTESAAALADLSPDQAERILERLANAHLIRPVSNGRYTIHDLLREFAQETCLADESATEREAAVGRLCSWYLARVQGAGQLLYPAMVQLPTPPIEQATHRFADTKAALSWLDAEHPNIVAVIRHVAMAGPRQVAWLLAANLRAYFDLRRHVAFWLTSARAGLAAARAARNEHGQTAMFHMLGHAYGAIARHDAAAKNLDRAIKLGERCGWHEGRALALSGLGVMRGLQGRPDIAAPLFTQALELFEGFGSAGPERRVLNNWLQAIGSRATSIEHSSIAMMRSRGQRAGMIPTITLFRIWALFVIFSGGTSPHSNPWLRRLPAYAASATSRRWPTRRHTGPARCLISAVSMKA
ncbi:MAG TPA: hypothetical protein DGG94_03855 [Micromonosporaceae bacterium]|nr:hypothetical protein [Micromonosporaceae bacterium]HCU48934.1 hypothetical protein [Micromonosporaceae bacterium]